MSNEHTEHDHESANEIETETTHENESTGNAIENAGDAGPGIDPIGGETKLPEPAILPAPEETNDTGSDPVDDHSRESHTHRELREV